MTRTIATLPAALRPTAAAWARLLPTTQRERQAVIRALPDRAGLSLTAALDACEQAASAAKAARLGRQERRIREHLPDLAIGTKPARDGCTAKPAALQARMRLTEPLADKLARIRRDAVLTAYRTTYRVPDAGHGDEVVILTADPAQVGVVQNKSTNWDLYRGKYKGWAADVTDTIITVPAEWRVRVQRQGLARVDGMMTLDASRLDGAPEGVELFAATWAEQGRGYAVTVARGYVARQGETTYHGDSPEKALSGLRRKLAGAQWAATLQAADLSNLLGRLPDASLDAASVRVSDARAIGACEYGIRSWCHATGLPYDVGHASLRQVWAAYLAQPRGEARAAILHALRRQRRLAAAA